jgi:hypothetical protein
MATTINQGSTQPYSILAGEDLSAAQWKAISQTNGLAMIAEGSDGDAIWGVLQDNPGIFEEASVVIQGFTNILLGEDCVENAMVGPLVDGDFGPSSTTKIAKATKAGFDGDVIVAYVNTLRSPATGGGGTATVTYHKATKADADNTPRDATDWPGGVPANGDLLEIEFTPLERNRRELMIWTTGPNFDPVVENLQTIAAVAHGLDLTAVEGQRVPVAWYWNQVTSRPPTIIQEVNHYAVAAPSNDTLLVRTAADMVGRTFNGVTNSLAAAGEVAYWDAATNLATLTAGELRMYQASGTDTGLIHWHTEDSRTLATANTQAFTANEWALQLTADLASGAEALTVNFVPVGATTGLPDFSTWATDRNVAVHAGGNLVARSGDLDTDFLGVGTGTGISFSRELFKGDVITVRGYTTE